MVWYLLLPDLDEPLETALSWAVLLSGGLLGAALGWAIGQRGKRLWVTAAVGIGSTLIAFPVLLAAWYTVVLIVYFGWCLVLHDLLGVVPETWCES